ncbi:hypothetical protein UCMB321_5572 [Pseudomonas batumici]|uniref:Uncharacterized protein n=1 Tax=Pseudomonas batumici TaxID=226910 RepID=A0A0C2I1A4_9PSED|nr:hypothetical protein UCMB321_5572 [Pseudomonas batumici]
MAGAQVGQGETAHRFAEGDGHQRGFASGERRVGDDDGRGRTLGVDGVVVGGGGTSPGVARPVLYPGVVQGDDVGGIGDIRRRGKGRGPGDTAVAAAYRAQGAIGDRQVGVGETGHRFAEGDGHQRGVADFHGAMRDHHGRGRAHAVDGIVVGRGGAAAGVARRVLDGGVVQGDVVARADDTRRRRERRGPGHAAVAAAHCAQGAIGDRQVGVAETGHRFAEGDGDWRGLTDAQVGIAEDYGRSRPLGVDGVAVRAGGAAAGIARHVADPGVVQGDDIAGMGNPGGRRQGRGPGDAAVAAAHRAQGAVGDGQVGVGEAGDRFAEGDGHQGGAADVQRVVGHHDARGRPHGVDRIGIGGGRAGTGVGRGIGIEGVVQGNDVAAADVARGRRQGCGPGDVVAGGQVAQGAVGGRHVGQTETAHRFAEGDGHRAGGRGAQRRAAHRNGRGRPHGVDGVVVRRGGAAPRRARRGAVDPGIVQDDMVGGAGDARIRGEGRGPGGAAVTGGDRAQGTVGHRQVGVGEPRHRLVEGNGHQRGAADVLGRVGDHDGRGRCWRIGGVQRAAVVEDIVHGRRRGPVAASAQRHTTGTAATDVAAHGREVGGGHQQRAFVPDRADTFTARASRVGGAAQAAAAATTAAGSDVVGNYRGADDGQGTGAGVVDTAAGRGTGAARLVPTGAATAAANGNGAVVRRPAGPAVTVVGGAYTARAAAAATTPAAHVVGVVAAAVTAVVGGAGGTAIDPRAEARGTTMATILSAKRTAAAATATDCATDVG